MTTQYLLNHKEYTDFIQNGRSILIFTTSWCKSAVVMSIVFDKLAAKHKDFLKFAKVDVDNYKEIIKHANVGAVPEFLIYKDGQLISRKHITKGEFLEKYIDKFLERENLLEELCDY